jgi:uncharacterized protein YbcC (UPF0753/DUF2309 family)
MQEKYNLRIIIDNTTYVHVKATIDELLKRDWNDEIEKALSQEEYDNKI